jgi:hypothetical protein
VRIRSTKFKRPQIRESRTGIRPARTPALRPVFEFGESCLTSNNEF